MNIWMIVWMLSIVGVSVTSYTLGHIAGWEKHKKHVDWVVKEQGNWETLGEQRANWEQLG